MNHYYNTCWYNSLRIKNKRQKKRIRITASQKKLLSIYAKQLQLDKAMRNQEYIPLNPPLQRGFKRYFILREDVSIGKDSDFFKHLLKKINTVEFSHRKDFKRKKKKKGKRIYVDRPQMLREFWPHELKKSGLTEKEMRFFKEVEEAIHKKVYKKFVFAQPWRYQLKISPHLITHIQRINPILLQQAAELDKYLIKHHLSHKLYKLIYGSCFKCNWKGEEQDKYKPFTDPKYLRNALQIYEEEKAPE